MKNYDVAGRNMRKSLQASEDYYVQKGFRGDMLRKALESDKEYQKLLAQRKEKIITHFRLPKKDLKRYVLSTDEDYKILANVHGLERKKLSVNDRKLVKFIRSQLELDWRRPLVKMLDTLLKRYESR